MLIFCSFLKKCNKDSYNVACQDTKYMMMIYEKRERVCAIILQLCANVMIASLISPTE